MHSTIFCFCGWCRSFPSRWSILRRRSSASTSALSLPRPSIGIIPATFTYAFVGAGLDSAIGAQEAAYNACMAAGRGDCKLDFDLKAAFTFELCTAFAALGVLALLPVVIKRWRARKKSA